MTLIGMRNIFVHIEQKWATYGHHPVSLRSILRFLLDVTSALPISIGSGIHVLRKDQVFHPTEARSIPK